MEFLKAVGAGFLAVCGLFVLVLVALFGIIGTAAILFG